MNPSQEKEIPDVKTEKNDPSEDPQSEAGDNSENVSLPRKEYEALTARLGELEDLKDKLLRSAADFENAKKRLVREKEEFVRFAQENLIRSLLPVVDNFERALTHTESSSEAASGEETADNVKAIRNGIERVYKQLLDILKAQGLTRISALGEIFNPEKHEAVAYAQEPGTDHEILEDIEAGYLLHGKLLRASKVKIRIAPVNSESPQEGASSD